MTASKILLLFCLAFIIGVAFASYSIPWWIGFFGLIIILLAKRRCLLIIAPLILLFFVLGLWRFEASQPVLGANRVEFYNGEKATIQGFVSDFPDVRLDSQRLKIDVEKLYTGEWKTINGRTILKTYLEPSFRYGDKLQITCNLLDPRGFDPEGEDFGYANFLARYDIYSYCASPEIELLGTGGGNTFLRWLFAFKAGFQKQISVFLSEPSASLLSGLILGTRGGIPKDLMDSFNRVGITHIIAISGFNITIISVFLLKFFRWFLLSRKKVFWITLLSIAGFVILAGAEPSVVRAAIMGSLTGLAQYLGRLNRPFRALVLTAAIMVLLNPKILAFDLGFQLSFLAMIGLVYFVPILEKLLTKVPSLWGIKSIFTTTLSAVIFTAPLILYQFSRISIIAPLVNVLVLPLIPIAMLFGFLMVFFGSVFSVIKIFVVGKIFGWLVWILLSYIIKISEFFASFSFSSVEIAGIPFLIIAALYLLLFYFTWRLNKNYAATN